MLRTVPSCAKLCQNIAIDFCWNENAPFPKIDAQDNYFYVTFDRSNEYLKMVETETVQRTPERSGEKTREKIIQSIKTHPDITTKDLAASLGSSEKNIEWHIKRLKAQGVLKRVGPDKGGQWEIVSS